MSLSYSRSCGSMATRRRPCDSPLGASSISGPHIISAMRQYILGRRLILSVVLVKATAAAGAAATPRKLCGRKGRSTAVSACAPMEATIQHSTVRGKTSLHACHVTLFLPCHVVSPCKLGVHISNALLTCHPIQLTMAWHGCSVSQGGSSRCHHQPHAAGISPG